MIRKIYTVVQRDGLCFSAKRAIAWTLARLPFGSKASFVFYKNYRLAFSKSMLTYVLFAGKASRQDDELALTEYCQNATTVIDVGAHIGTMTIIAASLLAPGGQVLAFEPSPKFFRILQKNIALNKLTEKVQAYPVAVGATVQQTFINEAVADDTTNHIDTVGTPVTQSTLDIHTQNYPIIDFLKIDVEGYELEVLLGAPLTLAKTKTIYIEFYTKNLLGAGSDPALIISLLTLHFDLFTLSGNTLVPFTYVSGTDYMVNLLGKHRG
jgi:FkbM family methyltransferase